MGLRETVEQKPVVAIVVIVVAMSIVAWRLLGSAAPSSHGQWFYDLQTGELVAYQGSDFPPVTLDNGHLAVSAQIWSCGSCDEPAEPNIAFLEKWSEQGLAYWRKRASQQPMDMGAGSGPDLGMVEPEPDRLVAQPPESGGEPQWYPGRSPMGMQITARVRTLREQCGGELVFCKP